MTKAQYEFSSDMTLTSLMASRTFGKRQLQLDYQYLFRRLVRGSGITRALEVGAFDAQFACWFARTFPKRAAVAYEANPYVAQKYSAACVAQGVDYRHACVSEQAGETTLCIPRDFRGSPRDRINQMASLLNNTRSEEVEEVRVPSVRLDEDIALSPEDRIVLWIDVEGALGRVLPHCDQVLERTVLINVEVERRPMWDGQWLDTDVAAFMAEKGFVLLARDNQAPFQYNCLYASKALFDLGAANPTLRRFYSSGFPAIEEKLKNRRTTKGESL